MAAMLITGNVQVDRWHLEHAANIVLDDQSNMKRAREFAEAAKSGGALVLAQLSFAGRQTPEAINSNPLSISDLRLDLPGYGAPKAATEEDLKGIIEEEYLLPHYAWSIGETLRERKTVTNVDGSTSTDLDQRGLVSYMVTVENFSLIHS